MQFSDTYNSSNQEKLLLFHPKNMTREGDCHNLQAFTYMDCQADGYDQDFFGQLTDALCTLPSTVKLRAILQMRPKGSPWCCLLVQGGDCDSMAELRNLLQLKAADASGIVEALGNLSIFPDLNVVKVQQGTTLTEPGMTGQLMKWLVQQQRVTTVVWDFVPQSCGGFGTLALTYLFRGDQMVVRKFGQQLREVMSTGSTLYSPVKKQDFLCGIRNHRWSRSRMVVTVGNAADLWPTIS